MSRRKKSSGGRRRGPTPPKRKEPTEADRPAPVPDPPRPSRPFLFATTALLAGWIAFLVYLAVRV
jgi:hypothetical protein